MAKADTKKTGTGLAAAAAAAAAAAGAAAAGYYFYASSDAKQNRKKAARWASDMKRDVVAQARKLQKLDREQLLKVIDSATSSYETMRSINQSDLKRAAQELKRNWTLIAQEAAGAAKTATRSAKSTVARAKKTAKKAVKKGAKKRR